VHARLTTSGARRTTARQRFRDTQFYVALPVLAKSATPAKNCGAKCEYWLPEEAARYNRRAGQGQTFWEWRIAMLWNTGRVTRPCLIAIAILVAGLTAPSMAEAAAPAEDASRARVTAAIVESLAKRNVPGASIAVVNDFKIDWAEGFGRVMAGSDQPVTPTTLFQAASISKPVAALVALRTVELGQLGLDDDVNSRLKSWRLPDSPLTVGRPVTLRQLLSHSAGLTVHGFPGYAADGPVPTLLQVLAGMPPANSEPVKSLMKPGYKFKYSGGGYSVVQQLLIDVTGAPFPEYAQSQVLATLEMTNSTYDQPLPDKLVAQAATGHFANGQPLDGRWRVHPEMAAAGLWTTPSDLAKVVIDVGGAAIGRPGKVLSPKMVAEMLKRQAGDYGLGFSLGGQDRSFTFSHGGANAGFRCLLVGVPATSQGMVIMTNSDSGGGVLQDVLPVVREAYAWPVGK
jgi:CubicO group peptidase (beta-lactamase class C family)